MKIAELLLKCKSYYASSPLVVMLFGGASLEACFNNFFDYKLFFFLSKESEAFCARRTCRSLPNEGADLRTDGGKWSCPDSERMEAKPIRLEGDTPGAWSKSKTGPGWVPTHLIPNVFNNHVTNPLRAITHPYLPLTGKVRSALGADSLQEVTAPLAPCGRGQNFKLSFAKLRNSGEGSLPAQRRSLC